jgi:prolipoprotein diacylglyceryltransferase
MLTYPEIDPVIFSILGLKIRWYGMMYVFGFLAGWWLARRRSRQPWSTISSQQVDDLVFYVMLGVIVGGRLGYILFYGWVNMAEDPLYIVKIWQGGMSFHGGLAGVLIAMWLYGRTLGNTMWQMTDFVAPLVPLGLGFGRIGNFINGELWGKPTDVRGRTRGTRTVRCPVVVLIERAAVHGRLGTVPAALRPVPFLYRVLPRPRCAYRLPVRRLGYHGPAAQHTDDHCRCDTSLSRVPADNKKGGNYLICNSTCP